MVKGITRQIILVRAPEQEIFEQAIFIVKENAPEVTEDMLLKEARKAIRQPVRQRSGPIWAMAGAACTGIVWLLTAIL